MDEIINVITQALDLDAIALGLGTALGAGALKLYQFVMGKIKAFVSETETLLDDKVAEGFEQGTKQ